MKNRPLDAAVDVAITHLVADILLSGPVDRAWSRGGERWVLSSPFFGANCVGRTAMHKVTSRHSPQGFLKEAHEDHDLTFQLGTFLSG
jgi:hypothetical protein